MKPEYVGNPNSVWDWVLESVEQSTETLNGVERSEDLGRFGRESNGWFIYAYQIYHLGRKEQERKKTWPEISGQRGLIRSSG